MLPPIDAAPAPAPRARPPAEAAALDAELDALHADLGVKRGAALQEALKPKLEVPMPEAVPAVPQPALDKAS